MTDLTAQPGGSGKVAVAVNDLGQVVGNGFLYSGGQFLSLQGLLPESSSGQWSDLKATAINDAGQIVGGGMVDGQEHAFLMTPAAEPVPEPSSLLVFGAMVGTIGPRAIAERRRTAHRDERDSR